MTCLRTSLYHVIRKVRVKLDMDIACQRIHGDSLSVCGWRTFSTKAFDINQVARSNMENSSLDGVNRSKTKASNDELSAEPENKVDVPHWFSAVLECPLYSDGKIDVLKQAQFKDFVKSLDLSYLPSVRAIIKNTEEFEPQKIVPKRWRVTMTKKLGAEKLFNKDQQGMTEHGISMHKSIEMTLKGKEIFNVKEINKGHWKSIQTVLGDVQNVKSLECHCAHPEMFYKGTLDCIAEFRDTLCLIEWKTSNYYKPLLSATEDYPLQVVAYMGAVNRSRILKKLNIPNLTNGALVIAYPNGEPAAVHMMSQKVCERYWRKWLDRLYLYWVLQFQQSMEK